MENWHIKLDYEKAIESKKQLLSSEINLLHVMKSMKNYSILRKREITIDNKIKSDMSSIRLMISQLNSAFPRQSIGPRTILKTETKIKEIKKIMKPERKSDFQKELEDIQAKLARLG